MNESIYVDRKTTINMTNLTSHPASESVNTKPLAAFRS